MRLQTREESRDVEVACCKPNCECNEIPEREGGERERKEREGGGGLKDLSIGKESLLESWNDFLPTLPTLVAAKLLKWLLLQ